MTFNICIEKEDTQLKNNNTQMWSVIKKKECCFIFVKYMCIFDKFDKLSKKIP